MSQLTRRELFSTAAGAALATPALSMLAQLPTSNTSPQPIIAASRFRVGEIVLTTINDGYFELDNSVFPQVKDADLKAALAASPQKTPFRGVIHAFLIETKTEKILVDGGAMGFAPTTGRLNQTLATLGVAPGSLKKIVATHLHADHVNGFADAQDKAIFTEAELFLHQDEHKFWMDPGLLPNAPDGFKPFVQFAQRAVNAYSSRLRLMKGNFEIAPGVTLEPAPGHTPGHSMIRVSSGKEQALIWADIMHVPAVQFSHPDWVVGFDTDGQAARAARLRVLDQVAKDRIPVLGSHLPFPAVGYVSKRGKTYAYEPAFWDFDA